MYVASKDRFMKLQRSDLDKLSKKELLQIARYGRRSINQYVRNIENKGFLLPLKELKMLDPTTFRVPLISSTSTKNELINKIEGLQIDWGKEALSTPKARELESKYHELIDVSEITYEEFLNLDLTSISWIDVLIKMGYSSDDAKEIMEEKRWSASDKFDYLKYAIEQIEERKKYARSLGLRL